MTKRYPGGYITKTAPTVSTTSAPGIWTMEQQAAYQKAGTWPFGGPFTYIEDVFSTYLYSGATPSAITITNGIDLAGNGGMVWLKRRNDVDVHILSDSARGKGTTSYKELNSDTTNAQGSGNTNNYITSFNSNGFTISGSNNSQVNGSGGTYVSWTFRKQPKFFDVVTFTQSGTTGNQTISHSLGSTPGCIIFKCTSGTSNWWVYHRSIPSNALELNDALAATGFTSPPASSITSTSFAFNVTDYGTTNGATWVAYLFAHNAGGFGLTGTDNVISCGSLTTNGFGGATVNLGYEPQWVLFKPTDATGSWWLFDNMRGMPVDGTDPYLMPNAADAESIGAGNAVDLTATGFKTGLFASTSYIYIAIRRGPMKTPTTGTSVFSPTVFANSEGTKNTVGFPIDLQLSRLTSLNIATYATDRLRGVSTTTTSSGLNLLTSSTAAETTSGATTRGWDNTGFQTSAFWDSNNIIYWNFRRAPGFFDEVCDTGTGAAHSITHGLTVAPELIIRKKRTGTNPDNGWFVYSAALGATKYLRLESNYYESVATSVWNNTSPTASVFTVGTAFATNESGATFVSYLFASCPGVSKVGSYTGTGATQTISCGFAARFVLIKRTDYDGDWFVWDTARGMVAGTDPRLALNSTAAESNANWVYTDAAGFQIVTTDATVNASGGSYIYLAIA